MTPLSWAFSTSGDFSDELDNFMRFDIERKVQLHLALRIARDLWEMDSFMIRTSLKETILAP